MMVLALDGLVVLSAVAGIALGRRAFGPADPKPVAAQKLIRARSPLTGFTLVLGLIYLNQLLMTIYVWRVWHGDTTRVARFLPSGWFDVPEPGGLVGALAAAFPAPELLGFSVLRAQAFLELPLVVLAYLVVCGWFSPGVQAAAASWPVLSATCVAWTATFAWIEWSLDNPWTAGDLAIRAISAVICPILVHRFMRRTSPGGSSRRGVLDGVRDLADLAILLASIAAFGALVLVVYDTALLYNPGHIPSRAPVAAGALVVLLLTRRLARRVSGASLRSDPGPGGALAIDLAGAGLVLFAVPALPVRYGLGFGAPRAALVSAVAVGVGAWWVATGRRRTVATARCAAAALAAAVPAALVPAIGSAYPEVLLLMRGAVFAATTIGVLALFDRRGRALRYEGPGGPAGRGDGRPPHRDGLGAGP